MRFIFTLSHVPKLPTVTPKKWENYREFRIEWKIANMTDWAFQLFAPTNTKKKKKNYSRVFGGVAGARKKLSVQMLFSTTFLFLWEHVQSLAKGCSSISFPGRFRPKLQGKSPRNEIGYSYLATLQLSFAPEQNSCMSLVSSPYRDEIDSLEVFAHSQCTEYRPSKSFQSPDHISRTSTRPQLFPASAADK